MTKVILLSSHIIVPSNFWRSYLISHFHINQKNIITTYEAVDPNLKIIKNSKPARPAGGLKIQNYIIYTGNLYPHKNIIVIFEALQKLPQLKLKIICARDIFAKRAIAAAKYLRVDSQIEFLGYVPDNKFKSLYASALALIHPALLEGFSLTGLEAMSLNCPVISSNASCLPEIYGNSVLYFDPHQPEQLVKQITALQKSPSLRSKMIKLGHLQVQKYSWENTATLTLKFYEKQIS